MSQYKNNNHNRSRQNRNRNLIHVDNSNRISIISIAMLLNITVANNKFAIFDNYTFVILRGYAIT